MTWPASQEKINKKELIGPGQTHPYGFTIPSLCVPAQSQGATNTKTRRKEAIMAPCAHVQEPDQPSLMSLEAVLING